VRIDAPGRRLEQLEAIGAERVQYHAGAIGRPDQPVLVSGFRCEACPLTGLRVVDPDVAGLVGVVGHRDCDPRAVWRQLDIAVIGHRADAAESRARAIEPRETREDLRPRLLLRKNRDRDEDDEASRDGGRH
jgi:hypothetical protein